MGGAGTLLLPVGPTRMSSWEQHQRRNPRSSEPGTDFYVPIGTPVVAPADGRIYGAGDSIKPDTGRWVGIDFFNGMRFRCMHHSQLERVGGTVEAGELIAYSGASGYGEENWSWNPATGGAHTHATLWPTHVSRYGYNPATNRPYTIDFMNFAASGGGGGAGGFLMALNDEQQANVYNWLRAVYAAEFGPASLNIPQMTWAKPFGEAPGVAYYGGLDIDLRTQSLVSEVAATQGVIMTILQQLVQNGGGALDEAAIARITEAARQGAADTLQKLVLRPDLDALDAAQ